MTPVETLAEGCKILDSILVPSGFRFISGQAGKSSGGHFASGGYVRDERRLELHFRYSLGLVSYHFRELTASHESVIVRSVFTEIINTPASQRLRWMRSSI